MPPPLRMDCIISIKNVTVAMATLDKLWLTRRMSCREELGFSVSEKCIKKCTAGETCGTRQGLTSVIPLFRAAAMSYANSTVLVIDDDANVRNSVGRLLRSVGLDFKLFASISDFLETDQFGGPTCLVLDVRLPGQSGLDLQRELTEAKKELPIIFITGHGDIPMSVQAMKGGAVEFLTKPFRDQDLLDAIQVGLTRDRARRESDQALADLRERFASLSPREREIVIQVARGRLSKQIAYDIGIAEATVKVHRSRAMQKMKAGSLPELGQMAVKLKLVPDEPRSA
jgi:FixJ family two-component response regulator